MELIEKMESLLAEMKADGDKFYNSGNKSAGTRVRKGAMEISKLCKSIRVDVQYKKNIM